MDLVSSTMPRLCYFQRRRWSLQAWHYMEFYYTRNQFNRCEEQFLRPDDVSQHREVGLREVATAGALGSGRGYLKCLCKGALQMPKVTEFALANVLVRSVQTNRLL